MKRFVNLGSQLWTDDEEPDQFAWYCTVVDRFENFNDCEVWDTWELFKKDFQREHSLMGVDSSVIAKKLMRYKKLFKGRYDGT